MDPNTVQGAAPVAAPASDAAPDGAAPATSPQQRSDEPLWNKQEIVDLKKDVRSVKKVLEDLAPVLSSLRTQQPEQPKAKEQPQPPDAALAAVKALERKIELRDAFLSLGVTSAPHREMLEALVSAKSPENVHEFVAQYANALGVKAGAAPAAQPAAAAPASATPQRPAPPDPGPPGKPPVLPTATLESLAGDPERFNALPYEERVRLRQQYVAKGRSRDVNRFALAASQRPKPPPK